MIGILKTAAIVARDEALIIDVGSSWPLSVEYLSKIRLAVICSA